MFFDLFFHQKKDEGLSHTTLRKIPLFKSLSASELAIISQKGRINEFKKGDIIYRQGDKADAFYVLLAGRCRVYVSNDKNVQRTLAYLHQGEYFGEVSLLTDKPHAAFVEAKNDAITLKIDKKDFFSLMHNVPPMALQISRRLSIRIKKLYHVDPHPGERKIITLMQSNSPFDERLFVVNFCASLHTETRNDVVLIDIVPNVITHEKEDDSDVSFVPVEKLSSFEYAQIKRYAHKTERGFTIIRFREFEEEAVGTKKISSLLGDLIDRFKYVVINVSGAHDSMLYEFAEQSDLVFIVAKSHGEHLFNAKKTIQELRSRFNLTYQELKLILQESAESQEVSIKQKEKLIQWPIAHILPIGDIPDSQEISYRKIPIVSINPEKHYGKTIRFLAREVGEVLIGVALGSGSAFGLAHIGVIKVLEEENIEVDMIAGSSIGSVVGGLWACGYTSEDIKKVALSFRNKKNLLNLVDILDLCPPHFGFFKGRTVKRFLKKYIGDKEFKDLLIPLRIVATNLETSEDVVFKEGKVVDAIRASISIPGIVKPVNIDGKHLIDGGVTNPLPINLLRNVGVRKVISVNVLPFPQDMRTSKEQLALATQEKEALIRKKHFVKRVSYNIGKMLRRRYVGNIFNVMMNTVQYLEAAVSAMQQSDADIVLHPFVPNSHWAEFYAPEKFIQAGEDAAKEVIEDIRKLKEE